MTAKLTALSFLELYNRDFCLDDVTYTSEIFHFELNCIVSAQYVIKQGDSIKRSTLLFPVDYSSDQDMTQANDIREVEIPTHYTWSP